MPRRRGEGSGDDVTRPLSQRCAPSGGMLLPSLPSKPRPGDRRGTRLNTRTRGEEMQRPTRITRLPGLMILCRLQEDQVQGPRRSHAGHHKSNICKLQIYIATDHVYAPPCVDIGALYTHEIHSTLCSHSIDIKLLFLTPNVLAAVKFRLN